MVQVQHLGWRNFPAFILFLLFRILLSIGNLSANVQALRSVWRLVVEKGDLVRELTNRQIRMANAGRGLGASWQFFHPLLVAVVYIVVVGYIIGGRLVAVGDAPGSYPSYILAGLVPWLMTQTAMSQATGALVSNDNLVKQVIFPIEALPLASAVVAMITYIPALIFVLLYIVIFGGGFSLMLLMFPILLTFHFVLVLGLSFALSSVTVFIRDVRELVNVFSVVAIYLMPIIYIPAWIPSYLKPIVYLNPFSYLVWAYQDMLFFNEFRHPLAWAIVMVLAVASLALGARIFAKLRPYYGNVL